MNRTEAKAHAEVMLAFANGKTIEFRRRIPSWLNNTTAYPWQVARPGMNLAFNFSTHEYHVKREPEEFFITVYGNPRDAVIEGELGDDDSVGSVYSSAVDARKGGTEYARVFRVTEVIE